VSDSLGARQPDGDGAAAAGRTSAGAAASPVILVVALAAERHALRGSLRSAHHGALGNRPIVRGTLAGRDVLLVQAGIGRERARQAVIAAAGTFGAHAVWSLGFAGGLADALRPGDLVCPGAILDDGEPTGALIACDASHTAVCAALRHARLPVDSGALITVEAPLRTPEAKRAAHRRSGAVAVEMEAAGVARAAQALGIPWAALKVVVDAVGDPLPASLARCTSPEGDLRWRALLAGALTGRRFWRPLWRLGRASRLAGRNLWQGFEVAFGAWAALTP
jgi:adenosylhomocysteine nucleosidase